MQIIFYVYSHKEYIDKLKRLRLHQKSLKGVMDACNIYRQYFKSSGISYTGIGRGKNEPSEEFIKFVFESFQAMEHGLAIEL